MSDWNSAGIYKVDLATVEQAVKSVLAAHNAKIAPGMRVNSEQLAADALGEIIDHALVGPTANELGNAFQGLIEKARDRVGHSPAGRDFSEAITCLEDALTRYNSGRYREQGTWKRADPDLPR